MDLAAGACRFVAGVDQPLQVEELAPVLQVPGAILAQALDHVGVLVADAAGPGFEEVVYQRALAKEFPAHGVDWAREVWVDVMYKGEKVGRKRVDFVVGDDSGDVMIEIKAKSALEDVDFVQALSYLRASGYKVGLLINFGGKRLEIKRLAN